MVTPAELIESGDPALRHRGQRLRANRLQDGWSMERAMTTPVGRRGRPLAGFPAIDGHTPWSDDERCRALVESHPDGMTLHEVGVAFGVSRERIRQIEEIALKRLLARCELAGISREDVGAMLSTKPGSGTDAAPFASGGRGAAAVQERHDPLPVTAWSEHGQRVEGALVELERIVARLEAA